MKRKEIIWLRSPFVTCHYPEGFRWLTSHPKPRVGKLKRDKFGKKRKSIKNRYRFCTIWLVGLEEEIIDKDFTQSYWLALQFWVQPNRIFTVGVPQASHGIKSNSPVTYIQLGELVFHPPPPPTRDERRGPLNRLRGRLISRVTRSNLAFYLRALYEQHGVPTRKLI